MQITGKFLLSLLGQIYYSQILVFIILKATYFVINSYLPNVFEKINFLHERINDKAEKFFRKS